MSLQFDAEYYLAQYADVAAAVNAGVLTAQAHWEQYGAAEGRNPNAIFNTEEYLAANPDVAASGMNPLDHFLQYGAAEGRAPNAAYQPIAAGFDSDAYLAANPDVAAAVQSGAFASAYEHWVEYGQFEDTREATYNGGTPVTGITDPAAGETTDLAKGVESVTGTAGDDTFNGVVSALSSSRTLDAGDSLDGGEGSDTLNVDLQTSFAGFSGDGGMTGVETVNLSNEGSIGRNFDASGVEGVEQYNLNGNVNLVDVADATAAVAIADRTADLTVDYADKATDGSADALDLSVSNVGTVEDADTTKVERQDVAVNADGIESLNLTTDGDNVLDLSGVNAKAITASGTGTLDTSVAAATKTFDASANEGAVKVDLGNASDVTAVQTGAGDDTITATTGNLATNAVIDGGDGANTLALSGSGTVQYQMSNVQTLDLGNLNSGTLTFSTRDTSGLETVAAGSNFAGTATLAGLGTQDMAFDLSGANSKVGTITADNAGVSVVTVSASDSADADSYDTNTTGLKLTQTSAVDLTVGEYVDYQGNITAQKAQSLEVTVAGEINNTIDAGSATGAVFNVTNSADNASSNVTLNAQKLVDLNVTAASDLDMGSSALGALESLTVDTDGAFQIGDLGAINVVNLSGTGSANLGALGATTQNDYGITVNAEGLNDGLTLSTITTNGTDIDVNAADVLGNVTLGAVNAGTGNVNLDLSGVAGNIQLNNVSGDNVTIDASGALGTVDYDGTSGDQVISVADSVTLNGAELSANVATIDATGESFTATLNGGIQKDAYTLNLDTNALKNVDLNGDLGIQGSSEADSLVVNLADDTDDNASTATYNVAGVESLAFDWGDSASGDTLTLNGSSSLAGVDTLTVHNGTLDISAVAGADAFAGSNIVIGSGVKMTAAQFANVLNVTTTSADARIDIKIDTAEQAQQVAEVLNKLKVQDGGGSDSQLSNIGLQVAQSVVNNETALNALKAAATSHAVQVDTTPVDDNGDTSGGDVDTIFTGSINDVFTTPNGEVDSVELSDAASGADVFNLTGGTLDMTDAKTATGSDDAAASGGRTTLDLSDTEITGDVGVTLATLADNNKGDLVTADSGGVKSDQSVELPSLADIDGNLTITNMTVASTPVYEGANDNIADDGGLHNVQYKGVGSEQVSQGDSIAFHEWGSGPDETPVEKTVYVESVDENGVTLFGDTTNVTAALNGTDGTFALTAKSGYVISSSNDYYRDNDGEVTNDTLVFSESQSDVVNAIKSISITADDNGYLDFTLDLGDVDEDGTEEGSLVLDNLIRQETFDSWIDAGAVDGVSKDDGSYTVDGNVTDLIGLVGGDGTFVYDGAAA